jgi:16S rRNA (guanine1516-N2)-methyltransferase
MNPGRDDRLSKIADQLGLPEVVTSGGYQYLIERDGPRIRLTSSCDGRMISHQLEIDGILASLRSFPASRRGAFNQAIGRRTYTVVDATGGMGGDSLLLCTQGYRVTTLERIPLLATLLEDAFSYLGTTSWAKKNNVYSPVPIEADARSWLVDKPVDADCIYVDTMFPAKRKTSAGVNKDIRLLQDICGPDDDANELLEIALRSGVRRVVVKRPRHAKPISGTPAGQFSGKLVRYDLYIP